MTVLVSAIVALTQAILGPSFVRVPDHGIQPQALTDSSGRLHLIYFKGDPSHGDLIYCTSRDGGFSFSAPTRVNSIPKTAIAVGNIRGGQFSLGSRGSVHVIWNGAMVTAGTIQYARLTSGDKNFQNQITLQGETANIDGGASIASDSTGNVYAVWHANLKGDRGENSRQIWLARSNDNGAHFSHPRAAWAQATGACGCCSLKAMVGPNGVLSIAYRAAIDGVQRDSFLLTSQDFGNSFTGVNLHPWTLSYCPMSSYALLADEKGTSVAWETQQRIYGMIHGKIVRIGSNEGRQQHPFLCRNRKGETLVVWTEGVGWNTGGQLAWRILDAKLETVSDGKRDGVPVWSLVTAFCAPNGNFVVVF